MSVIETIKKLLDDGHSPDFIRAIVNDLTTKPPLPELLPEPPILEHVPQYNYSMNNVEYVSETEEDEPEENDVASFQSNNQNSANTSPSYGPARNEPKRMERKKREKVESKKSRRARGPYTPYYLQEKDMKCLEQGNTSFEPFLMKIYNRVRECPVFQKLDSKFKVKAIDHIAIFTNPDEYLSKGSGRLNYSRNNINNSWKKTTGHYIVVVNYLTKYTRLLENGQIISPQKREKGQAFVEKYLLEF